MPWSTCGKPKSYCNIEKESYKMFSWVKGLSHEPLIESSIGTFFEEQVV